MAFVILLVGALFLAEGKAFAGEAKPGPLDPRGRIHIPIGIADTKDTLKTFVEAKGSFSPGFATYGVFFWVFDRQSGRLTAPTMDGVKCDRGLGGEGFLIPWSAWRAGEIAVRTEVCEVRRPSPRGDVFVVGARAQLSNLGRKDSQVSLYVALRPLGPAGGAVKLIAVSGEGDALLVGGHPAVVSEEKPSAAGVLPTDSVGGAALEGEVPPGRDAASPGGDCSGAMRFDLTVATGEKKTFGFVCPVLPGRRAVGHRWDGKSTWAQFDEAVPNQADGGDLQPDPGLGYYRGIRVNRLFREAHAYWKDLVGRTSIRLPDPRWAESFRAITGHVAMCMNDGAPDVSVVNYNVFNRDGVYAASILQKSGRFELAARAIDYFLSHPFSGRVYPEADNPGQILWIMGEHWLFTRERRWLERVYPSVRKLVAMIEYYRTAKGPHWVSLDRLEFGDTLPAAERQELKPGRCDGSHPEYTEAFDIAGLRSAALLARALENASDAERWHDLAGALFEEYDERFGARLPEGYGSYSVLWPCRLYPLGSGKGHEQFKGVGARKPDGWRYFPLATVHQGLLAGDRRAGHATIEAHLDHEQMRGWYAFDEGGKSGAGGWRHARTTWNHNVAMPHGWAIAELHLLLRDSLLFEDGNRLVLLGGVPPAWFTHPEGMKVEGLPTHFGACSFAYSRKPGGAELVLGGPADPPGGLVLRLPRSLRFKLTADGRAVDPSESGDVFLPRGTKKVGIELLDEGPIQEVWSPEKAWKWYKRARPIRGCNYLPQTAVNTTEMWQAETFDPATIDQELGWAQASGYNSLRVFLQYIVWRDDPDGLIDRIDRFLAIAEKHGCRTMLVPFCDCSFAGKEPYPGKQDDPILGVHNSGWVPSPGLKRVVDRSTWPDLEKYIKDIVGRFRDDRRVFIWDLYNEPGNSGMGEQSLPLAEASFAWARAMNPSQPLTIGVWSDFRSRMSGRLMDLSDVITFHAYDDPDGVKSKIAVCKARGRPVISTEWLRRQVGNTFAAILPIFAEDDVGWYHWGLVAGRTQTYMPWGSRKGDPMPKVWQHDMFHPDGTPYDPGEIEFIRTWGE